MSDSRRDFLKKVALLTGGAGAWHVLPGSIHKAMAIAPDPGTTFYDAEHVVMLMQENRSFDHCFGTLKGVRGFNDPRAINLPGKFPVWLQPDNNGNRFAPFRLDIKNTKITWMGGVPHSWEDQVDARNEGKYDGWIEAKRPGNKQFKDFPMTMGYYSREDIPFYYALADAFTVCDQHFCASLTGTTTNRNYFWTGKTHNGPHDKAKVRNGEMGYDNEVNWKTFPERLEEADISWRVYQNEVSLPTNVEDSSLLANFTDNNLEWFEQYGVRFSVGHYEWLQRKEKELKEALESLKAAGKNEEASKKQVELTEIKDYINNWNPEKFNQLSSERKNLHSKAFTTNIADPDYHRVEAMNYNDGGEQRETHIPKGDILHQFRSDVNNGKLPTVSWVVAPQKFSDHPSAPWYGAWYVSEVLDILTKNPEVWKKTIFILNYDENDGYFDHVPPFVAPNPANAKSGKVSQGLDVEGEFVTKEQEKKEGFSDKEARTSPVGLGFRVPLVVASPWSRGGWVNSEVCDITSTIQFLEKFLSKKTGKNISEPNISSWRRAVSGDLTSVFRPYNGEKITLPEWVNQKEFTKEIYNAKFKADPGIVTPLSESDARIVSKEGQKSGKLPVQESGTKPSNALKYDLHTVASISEDGKHLNISFEAAKGIFGDDSLGAPFNVYAPGNYKNEDTHQFEPVKTWAFAVKSGDKIEYQWPLSDFEGDSYHLQVYGPNGYFRDLKGKKGAALPIITSEPVKEGRTYKDQIKVVIEGVESGKVEIIEEVYEKNAHSLSLKADARDEVIIDISKTQGWYDFKIKHSAGEMHFAGRLELGKNSISDPAMA
ncbi:phospholipase C, phosphocholine-specific [Fulvivirga maritima]|uniref:phosphocholine-specific phospholipase C n=1 Tax=Fulvivirga maritima TaxID=2904247 RepID=UPI001F3E9AB0|nr:phospholipase C, phosphocholine-specific [Fulvivirga maritima]UII25064.1 phospholipase C, phosphocholine-specific [Fulvivirga maritima]